MLQLFAYATAPRDSTGVTSSTVLSSGSTGRLSMNVPIIARFLITAREHSAGAPSDLRNIWGRATPEAFIVDLMWYLPRHPGHSWHPRLSWIVAWSPCNTLFRRHTAFSV